MKVQSPVKRGMILGVGIFTTALAAYASLSQARGDLVFDEEASVVQSEDLAQEESVEAEEAKPTRRKARAEERTQLRQVLKASKKAQDTAQSQAAEEAIEEVPVAEVSIPEASVADAREPNVQLLSKSELMRRQRVREELKNEDVLQERLEELRLRDERRRTDQVLGISPVNGAEGEKAVATAPIQEQVVVAPATERPAPALETDRVSASSSATLGVTGAMTGISAMDASSELAEEEEKIQISVMPRGGISGLSGRRSFNPHSQFTAGLTFGVGISENLSFEGGYSFSEFSFNTPYSLAMGSPDDFFAVKNNLFDLGLKVHVLSPKARLRPFVAGGGAYSLSFTNFNAELVDYYQSLNMTQSAQDHVSKAFLGYLATGFDVRITKSLSFGAIFKYYARLSSSERSNLTGSVYSANGQVTTNQVVAQVPASANDYEKHLVGGSVSKSSMYSILGGLTFSF